MLICGIAEDYTGENNECFSRTACFSFSRGEGGGAVARHEQQQSMCRAQLTIQDLALLWCTAAYSRAYFHTPVIVPKHRTFGASARNGTCPAESEHNRCVN